MQILRILKMIMAGFVLAGAGTVQASLMGDEITVSMLLVNSGEITFAGPTTVTVGAGTELVDFGNTFSIDFGSDYLNMDCTGSFCGNGNPLSGSGTVDWLFELLDWSGAGSIIDVVFNSNIAGATASFNDGSLRLSIPGSADPASDEFMNVSMVTRIASVPEPDGLALLAIGLLGVFMSRRRTKR
ncbi:PEP-CTERM sorting domain-containing protein [Aestuariirhabdus sp. Z084]|uniref:PEP-CTERM sorting domain-containing protein n=1 Tax=Aestuariirhabdus haliotis TaxID=2918751 RepID=UPI00201B38C6|nr:PEP-CTERM sorting domain-containing protein [Aestuariirhabdus haliotis]MCL6416899.1 PEP-CTERM sorting domain-containing protein [Aestuariirhabdus haliotis]MCL6420882.1 PEP-CTERM sorting domain-containing protein [Aestuariirhabdus haliotis]